MNNQLKAIAIQWIGPTAILMLALVIMLLNFSTKSQVNANNTVTRNVISAAETCSRNFNDEITLLEKVGMPIAEIFSYHMAGKSIGNDASYEAELLEIARINAGAHMSYLCDEEGNAVNNSGEQLSIAGKDFFEYLYESDEISYLYTKDDGLSRMNAVLASIPVDVGNGKQFKLLLLYDLNKFTDMVKKYDFNAWNIETIIDKEGNVIASYGNASYWKQGDNIYDAINSVNSSIVNKVKSQINSSTSAVIQLDSKTSLVYAPLGSADWTVVYGISETYISRQVQQQWISFKKMVYQLVIVFCIFILFVVSINIISKVYNNRKQQQLESKADTDLLTGLNNKLATERKIKEYISQHPGSQSMLFIFDIDNFKKINDTMGHAFGDEVLRSLGQQIRVIFRASDVVGRAGGDEFIVFLKNVTEAEAIRKEAKKVEDFFKDFKAGEYTKYSATASIGVAIYPHEGTDFESIYKAADSALYKAKERGKNQLAFYNEEWLEKKK